MWLMSKFLGAAIAAAVKGRNPQPKRGGVVVVRRYPHAPYEHERMLKGNWNDGLRRSQPLYATHRYVGKTYPYSSKCQKERRTRLRFPNHATGPVEPAVFA